MKRTCLFAVLTGIAFAGVLSTQEADFAEENISPQEEQTIIIDADNPGMGLLDQATEAKLRASTIHDLTQVIFLCQRARKTGLSGENLKYCNQLLASTQLQRGLFLAQELLNPQKERPGDWKIFRQTTLNDLEEAVMVVKDQPVAYIRIAQLNLLPDGNDNRAKEALKLAISCAKDEPALQLQAIRMLATLEPDPEKLEVVLAAAAKNGNAQIKRLHALTLLELHRNSEAMNVLKNLIETESGNDELHRDIVTELTGFGKHELAMKVLDLLSEKATDERKDRIDLMKATLYFRMDQYDDALTLLDAMNNRSQSNTEFIIEILILRSDVYLAMDETDKAMKDIDAAEKKAKSDSLPSILQQKYTILMEQEKFNEALEVAKKLQSINPEDRRNRVRNRVREIHALTELKQYEEALGITQELRKQYPEEPQWTMLLLEIHVKQKAYDKALALVEEQLKTNSDELRWMVIKAQIFAEQKQWDEAVQWLESCLNKHPDSREINLVLIGVLADKKSFGAAKERIQSLLAKEPDDLRLLRLDSQISISLGRHHDAIKVLTKVTEIDPNDYTSINNLSWLLSTSPIDSVRNGRRALELAEKASELSRYKEAFVLSTLAAAHAELGNFDKAREWSQKSIDLAKKEKNKTEDAQKELLDNLQKELDSFNKDMPYRELLDSEH